MKNHQLLFLLNIRLEFGSLFRERLLYALTSAHKFSPVCNYNFPLIRGCFFQIQGQEKSLGILCGFTEFTVAEKILGLKTLDIFRVQIW